MKILFNVVEISTEQSLIKTLYKITTSLNKDSESKTFQSVSQVSGKIYIYMYKYMSGMFLIDTYRIMCCCLFATPTTVLGIIFPCVQS